MIAKEQVVTLNYRLKEGSTEGNLIEETYGKEPMSFIYGVGGMIPKFEQEIENLKEGDKFSFTLTPEEGYGELNPEAVVNVPKNIFEIEGKIEEGMLVVGNVIPMSDNQGQRMDGIVKEVTDETVKMDFNHPLAGVSLHFEGDIVSTRKATAEELDHGHVHGEGGHQH
jgi:FKBP-type peptidyl-prolyl cis-trans isomerase SlyD